MTPPLLSPFTLSHLCQIGRDGENEKSFREISSLITGFKEKYADFAQERLQKELSQCKTLVENLVSYKRNARSELQKFIMKRMLEILSLLLIFLMKVEIRKKMMQQKIPVHWQLPIQAVVRHKPQK
jgi:hypothetical protein